MKRVAGIGALLICASGASVIALQEAAKPSKEHEWLRSMVGKWDSEVEVRGNRDKGRLGVSLGGGVAL